MKTTYTTQGTCARFIDIELDGETVTRVNFIGGCNGNTSGLSALLQGMNMQDVILRLKGIRCQGNTSCPDQLVRALEAMQTQRAGNLGAGLEI